MALAEEASSLKSLRDDGEGAGETERNIDRGQTAGWGGRER